MQIKGEDDATNLEKYKAAVDRALTKLKSQQKKLEETEKKCSDLTVENEELKNSRSVSGEGDDDFKMPGQLQELRESPKRGSYIDPATIDREEAAEAFNKALAAKDEEIAKLKEEMTKKVKDVEMSQAKIDQFNKVIKAKTMEVTELTDNMAAFEEISNKKTEQLLQIQDDFNSLQSKFERNQSMGTLFSVSSKLFCKSVRRRKMWRKLASFWE